MTATKRLSAFPSHTPGWKLKVNGELMPPNTEWEVGSRHGSIKTAVVVNPDGSANFDRPIVYEAPATNVVAWGWKKRLFWKDEAHVAVIRQPRPHADDPTNPSHDGHAPIVMGQLPMGFREKLLGGKFESAEKGAIREVGEETGATAVLRVDKPRCPWHNPNPTFVGSWTDLLFVEVDLAKVERLKADRSEPIYTAEYIPIRELLRRIREGKDDHGAYYRMCTANSLWLIFFATYPELWPK